MISFSNYYCLFVVLIVKITTCQTNDSNTTDIEIKDSADFPGLADNVSGSDSKFVPDVCKLPIDEGDCRNESLGTDGDIESVSDLSDNNEFYEVNELTDLNELNESNTLYFGYNKSTKKCEQFNYDGCGGNANRFGTVNDCRKTCYTPLKNFLAKVTDLLLFRITNGSNGTSELPTT